jgi:glutathione synthase/RimK-type ligase-like ATP-grasp enzyme
MSSSNKVVLIPTTVDDLHTSAVVEGLKKRGIDTIKLERETFGSDWVISGRQGAAGTEVYIETREKIYGLESIGAIWMRRDFTVETIKKESTPEALYIATQSAINVNGIFAYLSHYIPCMNKPDANRRCSSKFYQANIAQKNGLKIPESFQGGSPDIAMELQKSVSLDRDICIKPLEAVHLKKNDGTTYAHYTTIFERRKLNELESLKDCPVILQEFLPKDVEVRATVVGDQIFAASIDTKKASPEAQVDWRHYDWANTPYYKHQLPEAVCASLLGIMKSLDLSYGAFDLVKTISGDYYFLEVNSQGQWLWVEDLTDLKITDSVAEWLTKSSRENFNFKR